MEPLAAVSLAATVVQFVDFNSKIVSKGYHLYKASDGVLSENEQLEYVITDLKSLNARLKHHEKSTCRTKDEQTLEDLSYRCSAIADVLLTKLDKLKVEKGAKFRKWKSFRQALKTVWTKDELDRLAETLSMYRNQLEFHILLSMRETNDLWRLQQMEQFEKLDEGQKNIIRLLSENRNPFADELKVKNNIIAKLHHDTKDHITHEHERTRTEIVKAIWTSRVSRDSKHGMLDGDSDKDDGTGVIVEDSILRGLRFPSMNDRYDRVEDAFAETFDWIFQKPNPHTQPWSDFSEWLSHGDGIYWINGKAGSGKSTLVRYIYEDPRTPLLLQHWVGPSRALLTVGFFFWKSGVPDQASQLGLLRSLLYAILSQTRQAMKTVFPKEWEILARRVKAKDYAPQLEQNWTERQLRNALEALLKLDLHRRVCIFVDGLDEYTGNLSDTIQLFKRIVSSEVKICVSSRPWVEFHEAFGGMPTLRVQELTFDDIQYYVNRVLGRDSRFIALREEAPREASIFVDEIVTKADGVFLWVKLVVISLLDGIMNGDRILELHQRLRELPSDLENLYGHMLAGTDPRYFVERAHIFQLVHTMLNFKFLPAVSTEPKPFCALTLSFALEEDNLSAINCPMGLTTASKVARRVERAERRLKICCAGLVEVSIQKNREMPPVVLAEFGNKPINYIHRTAMDYLHTPEVWKHILDVASTAQFNVNMALLRSYIFRLKSCDLPLVLAYGFKEYLATLITLAYYVDREGNLSLSTVELFDELGKALSRIQPKGTDSNVGQGGNWSEDFLILAAEFLLRNYLKAKFDNLDQLPRASDGRSYIYHVLKPMEIGITPLEGLPDMVAWVLRYSSPEDINEGWISSLQCVVRGSSKRNDLDQEPSLALHLHFKRTWLSIFRLFYEYGADSYVTIRTGDEKRSVRDVYSLINLPEIVREMPTLLQWPYYEDGKWCAAPAATAQENYPGDQRIEPSSMPQITPRPLTPRPFLRGLGLSKSKSSSDPSQLPQDGSGRKWWKRRA